MTIVHRQPQEMSTAKEVPEVSEPTTVVDQAIHDLLEAQNMAVGTMVPLSANTIYEILVQVPKYCGTMCVCVGAHRNPQWIGRCIDECRVERERGRERERERERE